MCNNVQAARGQQSMVLDCILNTEWVDITGRYIPPYTSFTNKQHTYTQSP